MPSPIKISAEVQRFFGNKVELRCFLEWQRIILFSFLVIATTAFPAVGQQTSNPQGKRDIRISRRHPSIYISFVKIGEIEPLGSGESNQRVWLRLHNNTRWNLRIRYAGSPPKEYGEGIAYSVKTFPKDPLRSISVPRLVSDYVPPGIDLPKREIKSAPEKPEEKDCENLDFFYGGHVFTIDNLPPGKSLTFSVPREYLCKDNYITVSFEYEWEPKFDDVYHEVHFSGSQIPKNSK